MDTERKQFIIRQMRDKDLEQMLDIYAPYVLNTAITFECEIPSSEEFNARFVCICRDYPCLIAECNHEIIGYAYYQAYNKREAYRHCAEISVYIKQAYQTKGIGKCLYHQLESIALQQHIYRLYACIAYPQEEDKYLSMSSVRFHEHMGYHLNGYFKSCGYKFTHWYDMIWMEKVLKEANQKVLPFISFQALQN